MFITYNIFAMKTMDYILLVVSIFGLSSLAHGQNNPGTPGWGYEYWNGPKLWPKMYPQFCGGKGQSPINVKPIKTVFNKNLPRFRVIENYSPKGSKFSVNNGEYTVQVKVTGENYIEGGGLKGRYKTDSLHFHWGDRNAYGSEHSMNGQYAPIEMHIKHTAVAPMFQSLVEAAQFPGGVAAFSILFKISKFDNPVLEPIIRALPTIADPDWNTQVEFPAISVAMLMPKHSHKFYRYIGSLTTPECNEGLIWTVFHMPQTISNRQLHAFRKVLKRVVNPTLKKKSGPGSSVTKVPMVNNFRHLQPLNGRTIYRSFLK